MLGKYKKEKASRTYLASSRVVALIRPSSASEGSKLSIICDRRVTASGVKTRVLHEGRNDQLHICSLGKDPIMDSISRPVC
jgi:hypothetical protein